MSQALVIVESPAKARTIEKYLGEGYVVESSIGHIRDLPKSAGDIPEKLKKEKWTRLGVNVDDGFKPLYVVDPDKKSHITHLKKLLKASDKLYLATDEDREGESIAWHLLEVLKPKVPVERMVFHEITKKAIQEALGKTRKINDDLVTAQEARRILDRLVGYEVSPVLWKKVMPKLSAGRVQSVATRVIVERERERMRFVRASYWDLAAHLSADTGSKKEKFTANLASVDGKRPASGKDFGEDGKLKRDDVVLLSEADANKLATSLKSGTFEVSKVEKKPYTRKPAAPFMTSTMQQEAGRKLKFSAKRAMSSAQRLYEQGFITYMRTDSTTLSETALTAARTQIKELYGSEYVPAAPRTYKKKVKNAQEAHEAIRPAGDDWPTPQAVAKKIGADEARLYELIWKRTVASQMVDAKGERLSVRIAGKGQGGENVELSLSGLTITFPGFLKAYVEGSDDPDAEIENKEKHLPALSVGQKINGEDFIAKGHETLPPARFTEASLVKRLEELGVGRPSTYASIIGTIQKRDYVWKKSSALIPSFKAFSVVGLLEKHFGHLVDYAFTAKMEDDLDAIASGERQSIPWLEDFYFGETKGTGLQSMVSDRLDEIDARQINTIPLGEDANGVTISVRVGRYGPYLERGEDRASLPEDIPPDELTLAKALEYIEAPSGDRELGLDPETELTIYLRAGRFGHYVQVGEAGGDKKEKPKTASILKSMDPATLTLEEALKVLALPRLVGVAPDGEEIHALNGRYGPYMTKAAPGAAKKDNRSLTTEDQMFTIDVEGALKIFAEPRKRGRAAAAAPLKELGVDPVSEQPILLKKGRFGPYVTDGETNASLRTADDPETITPERAQELLQIRRETGPTKKKKKKAAKKKATKKKTTKKAAKKKTTKKAAKKKTAAKKTTKKTAKKKATKKAD